MTRRLYRRGLISALFALSVLTGCFSVEVSPLEPPSGLQKLLGVSDFTVPVQIETSGLEGRYVGHQYLLFAIPITRLYLTSLATDVAMELSVACGMRGYRCTAEHHPTSLRSMKIVVRDVSVNGYDLLFVRKPTASVTLAAELLEDGKIIRSCEEHATATNTARYAFDAELQHALGEALLQASYKVLDCISLTGAPTNSTGHL